MKCLKKEYNRIGFEIETNLKYSDPCAHFILIYLNYDLCFDSNDIGVLDKDDMKKLFKVINQE